MGPAVRTRMENHFDDSFSSVRVHTDDRAGALTDSLNARAFTVGSHVVFAKGAYAPGTSAGRRLLAHELTHVVQQRRGNATIQCAETDTASSPCATLKDSAPLLDAFVNKVLDDARAAKRDPMDKVQSVIGRNSWTKPGHSLIEEWAENLPNGHRHEPPQASSKFKSVDYSLWSTTPVFDILNPTIKINGICIGSDKLGHFFQQGREYYDLATAPGASVADAKSYGKSTEAGGYGLSSTGVYSNADLDANLAGLQLMQDLNANPSGFSFSISNYIKPNWSEESNPSFYTESVGKQVWSNLLSGKWRGGISDGQQTFGSDVELKGTPTGTVTGKFNGTSGETGLDGTLSGSITYLTTSVAGGKNPISGVKIEFQWSAHGQAGAGEWVSQGENRVNGGWGVGHSSKGSWNLDKV